MQDDGRSLVTHTLVTRDGATIEVTGVPARPDPDDPDQWTYSLAVARRLDGLVREALGRRLAPGEVVTLSFGSPAEAGPAGSPVSRAVAAAIRSSGLSRAEVARRMGVAPSNLARLASPRYHGHSVPTLERLARALDTELLIDFAPRRVPRVVGVEQRGQQARPPRPRVLMPTSTGRAVERRAYE